MCGSRGYAFLSIQSKYSPLDNYVLNPIMLVEVIIMVKCIIIQIMFTVKLNQYVPSGMMANEYITVSSNLYEKVKNV